MGSEILPRFLLNNNAEITIRFNRNDIYSIGFCLMLVSIVFFFVSIASVGGIPILKPSIRYLLKPAFTMPVFLIIPATCLIASAYLKDFQNGKIIRQRVRFRFLLLLVIDCAILLTLGYRTPLLASFLIIIIIGYYGNIVSPWEVIVGALIGVGAIMGIGYFRSLGEQTITSATNPFPHCKAGLILHCMF